MKKLSLLALAFLMSAPSFAALDNSKSIRNLRLAGVDRVGSVLKQRTMGNTVYFTVGIPVKVELENACTKYVGHETTANGSVQVVQLKGATDPMPDACISIAVSPEETNLSVVLSVPGNAPVAIAHSDLLIAGQKYRVILDLHTSRVTISNRR